MKPTDQQIRDKAEEISEPMSCFYAERKEAALAMATWMQEQDWWLKYPENKPDRPGKYLCFIKGIQNGHTAFGMMVRDYNIGWDIQSAKVTHWQPLPKSPKTDSHE